MRTFSAVSIRGVCPNCQLFSRIERNGKLIVITEIQYEGHLSNDPRSSSPLAFLFEALAYGGGEILSANQFGGCPPLDDVHRELLARFKDIRRGIADDLPDTQYNIVECPATHSHWGSTWFRDAEQLHVVTWIENSGRFDMVCSLTKHGGKIHILTPQTEYHLTNREY